MTGTQKKILKALERGGYVIFKPHVISHFSNWNTVIDDEFNYIPARAATGLIAAGYLVPDPTQQHVYVLPTPEQP